MPGKEQSYFRYAGLNLTPAIPELNLAVAEELELSGPAKEFGKIAEAGSQTLTMLHSFSASVSEPRRIASVASVRLF